MNKKSRLFRLVDVLLLSLAAAPLVGGVVLQVLTKPPSQGISISGARIHFTLPAPLQALPITEAQINSWIVIVSLFFLCLYMTHGLAVRPETKRQVIAEWLIEQTESLVANNMGPYFKGFAPFVAAIMGLSAVSSLLTLLGMYPPTSDLNVVGGWALLVFFLITYYKLKAGPLYYLKSFAEPVAFLTPLNVIGEIATPVSMAFRHYGNILSGSVISVLVAAALQGLSRMVLGWLPGVLGSIPFLQIGLPAVLSIYFDVFSGCLQAFIFAMLTMLYIANGFPADEYEKRKSHKQNKVKQA
ncbi:MAG: F0F1 ATP synthase subunit A [Clostridia bacterium]|nr:F0F1 ATP synthase subunit A [Loktanella sp.]MBQ1951297.1 F0F1 ATP synthase subunit A [Clostridia bacterium]